MGPGHDPGVEERRSVCCCTVYSVYSVQCTVYSAREVGSSSGPQSVPAGGAGRAVTVTIVTIVHCTVRGEGNKSNYTLHSSYQCRGRG